MSSERKIEKKEGEIKKENIEETVVTMFGKAVAKHVRNKKLRNAILMCTHVYYDDPRKAMECTLRLAKLLKD